MAKSPKSFLLEQLRAQADAVAAKRVQQLKLSREVVDRLDQRMHNVFQYFDEACKLLQVISPPVERSFELPQQSGATYNVIRIAPGLRCEVRFDPDFEHGRIVATLRNVDRFEPVILDFETPALDTRALDDLVNLMLAKPSQFLLRAPLRGFAR